MTHRRLAVPVVALLTAVGVVACSEEAPVAPGSPHHMTADVIPLVLDPFTFRATLEPYKIHQLPDFMMHSKARTDIVIQRSEFLPGAGFWHIHPGPSFIIVLEGEIKVERFSRKNGCTQTQVFQPNDGYFEVANEVHRAVVVSSQSAVLLVARFNIPVGGAFTIPVSAPDC
ncbi:MAG TPA: cupin domain-containing protein [Gemmatimonadales bacterium]|nr:cupin domain-containing protein [Gemmatimonadales bacterium]